MSRQKILVVGSGGREHALAWKLAQSPRAGKIFIAPGNGGTLRLRSGPSAAQVGENVPIPANDIEGLLRFARANKIDFTVVGPDDPLAAGIVDEFKKAGLKVFGPTKAAAQLEASKAFAKAFMAEHKIPTAEFKTFRGYDDALRYVREKGALASPKLGEGGSIVVKASGLALGKGVTICRTIKEAEAAIKAAMIERVFGEAGDEVVIEEFLEGQEISIHAFSDGERFKLLPAAQDHKAIFDGDRGPNTGGMGTIAPVPWVTPEMMDGISRTVVAPVLAGMRKRGTPFSGILYPGLIMAADGAKVLEFNARFGDPETQSYMRLLKTDLLDVLEACVAASNLPAGRQGPSEGGRLEKLQIEWHPGFAACVVLASGGYPGKYKRDIPISGIAEAEALPDIVVFHAGTAVRDGKFYTNGGRVLGVTATGATLQAALDRAYQAVALIHFDGMQYRKDIGAKALK